MSINLLPKSGVKSLVLGALFALTGCLKDPVPTRTEIATQECNIIVRTASPEKWFGVVGCNARNNTDPICQAKRQEVESLVQSCVKRKLAIVPSDLAFLY